MLLSVPLAVEAAETFPVRPVRIIVASDPGATVDIATRIFGQSMAGRLGQSVVVENRGGAAGMVGVRLVKDALSDGYTILATSNSITARVILDKDSGVDLLKDFTGISQIVRSPYMMVIGAKQPFKSVADFVARVKASPGELSFASGGDGSAGHLAAAKFLDRVGLKAGADMLHVPYKGGGPARIDVIGGRVTVLFTGPASAAGDARSGLVKVLGVTSASRLPAFPDMPTIAEQGLPGYADYVWVALFAPARTPKAVVARLANAIQQSTAELRERFEKDGVEAVSQSPDEFTELLKREMDETAKLVTAIGLKKQ